MDQENRPNSNLECHTGSLDGLVRNNEKNQSILSLSSPRQQDPPVQTYNLSSRKKETCSLEELQKMDEGSILRQLAYDIPFRRPSSEFLANSQQPVNLRTSNQQLDQIVSAGNKGKASTSNFQSLLKKFDGSSTENTESSRTSRDQLSSSNCDCQEAVLLRQQVEFFKLRLAKLQKLEQLESEVENLHQSYHSLVLSTNKREILEKAMRKQLETDKDKLMDENQRLRDQVDSLNNRLAQNDSPNHVEEYYRQSLFKLQELNECRERQEIELAAQRATLDEQRNHINILEGALASAQEEARKRQQLLDRLQEQKFGRPVPRIVGTKQNGSHLRQIRQKIAGKGLSSVTEDLSADPDAAENIESGSLTPQQCSELEARIRNLENRLTQDSSSETHSSSRIQPAANQNAVHNRTRSLNTPLNSTQHKSSVSGNEEARSENSDSDRLNRPKAIVKEVKSQLWYV